MSPKVKSYTLTLLGLGMLAVPAARAAAASFPTDCQPLAYQEFGAGKPLVLLAGGPGMNPAYMTPFAQMLVADGRRVILLHQRGTGQSPVSCPDHLSLEGAVDDLEQLRAYLELPQIVIAGHSWGGMLAMAYAQAYPRKSRGSYSSTPGRWRNRLSPRKATLQAAGSARLIKLRSSP